MIFHKPTPPKTRFPDINRRQKKMTRSTVVRRFKLFTPQRNTIKHLRGLIQSQRLS